MCSEINCLELPVIKLSACVEQNNSVFLKNQWKGKKISFQCWDKIIKKVEGESLRKEGSCSSLSFNFMFSSSTGQMKLLLLSRFKEFDDGCFYSWCGNKKPKRKERMLFNIGTERANLDHFCCAWKDVSWNVFPSLFTTFLKALENILENLSLLNASLTASP